MHNALQMFLFAVHAQQLVQIDARCALYTFTCTNGGCIAVALVSGRTQMSPLVIAAVQQSKATFESL